MTHKRLLLAAFIIYVGVRSWYDLKHCHDWPWPPRFIGAGITLGMLALFSDIVDEELGSVLAIGIVLASVVKLHPWTTPAGDASQDPNCAHKCQGSPQPASLSAIQINPSGTGEILA